MWKGFNLDKFTVKENCDIHCGSYLPVAVVAQAFPLLSGLSALCYGMVATVPLLASQPGVARELLPALESLQEHRTRTEKPEPQSSHPTEAAAQRQDGALPVQGREEAQMEPP